jgi:hypothetical protein
LGVNSAANCWAQEKGEPNENELYGYYLDSVVYKSTPYRKLRERDIKVIVITSEKPIYSNFNIGR